MGSRKFGNQGSFTVPRPATIPSSSVYDVEETPTSSSRNKKKRQVRWSYDMDEALIDALLEVVLAGPRKAENGFKADECTKVVNKVLERCQVVVGVPHVRARLKTLKTDYKEITELFKTSEFGLDENGRVTADPLVWEKHLQDNPDAKNLKGKLCPRYYDLATIFGNDIATGALAITGNEMNEDEINNPVGVGLEDENELEETHPTHSSTANTPNEAAQGKGPRAKRKRGKSMDDAALALKIIAQSSQEMVIAFKEQVTQNRVDVQAILDKVRGFGLVDGDVMDLMQIFVHDEKEGRFFLEINDEAFLRAWVNRKLGK